MLSIWQAVQQLCIALDKNNTGDTLHPGFTRNKRKTVCLVSKTVCLVSVFTDITSSDPFMQGGWGAGGCCLTSTEVSRPVRDGDEWEKGDRRVKP